MTIVRIAKDWEWDGLLRQTPGEKGIWNGVEFTLEPVEECDYLVMLNNRKATETRTRCPEENVWAIMQEPYIEYLYDWLIEGHESFSKVFTHYPLPNNPKHIPSQPAIPWHVNKTFDQLIGETIPEKIGNVSWVTSKLSFLPGHKKKMEFLRFLQKQTSFEIEIFGRGINYINDKWNGVAPYRYSLAIENSTGPDYWTEKISDCFLAWTVPIYWGCTNLEDYFPKDSFIRFDINKPDESVEMIKRVIEKDDWQSRIPALGEARSLILYKYQIFPFLTDRIHAEASLNSQKTKIIIPSYGKKKWIHHSKYVLSKISSGDFGDLFSTFINKFKYIKWAMVGERGM